MRDETVGYIGYKLYSLGWQNRLHNHLSCFQHLLLSVFLYYRRGFAEGSEWVQDYCFGARSHLQ
jgi:hypothetical protein